MNFERALFEQVLSEGLQALGLAQLEEKVPAMGRFAELVVERNRQLNLTRLVEPREMAVKNFLDSLSILLLDWPQRLQCLDLGTGAGFPGVPLALAQEGWELVLLDSLRKRLAFLEEAAAELSLGNVRTFHARAEEAGRQPDWREQCDLVVSRAVAALPVLLELSTPLVKVGGVFAAYKGGAVEPELKSAARAMEALSVQLERVFPLELPLGMGKRNILLFRKTGPTPAAYPRRPGLPAKRPLE
ncbi:MAG TPA: 16S rRNA (guanine(527)-N(7))-methyltransferase RsmG [Limnochordia bacterium]|nr:16S rRNA (guanine(527)-N(7))-methyltransferase RsmG [Limnochordia bacterium]